jgi:heptosyltransferase III
MNSPKNILIVRTDRIGDVVLSLPVASVIKKHFPDCRVSFLMRGYTKALAENNPYIDEIITLEENEGKPSIPANVANLRNKFDACIVAFPTYPIALILFMSGIPIRIGTGYRWYSFLFNKKIYEHRKYGERHELEYNIRLLQHLGIDEDINEKNAVFGIGVSGESAEKISDEFRALGITQKEPVIIVHPGSGGSAVDLPVDKMKELVNQLCKLPARILITGNDKEKELCKSMTVNNTAKSLAGKFSLRDLIALINKSSIMIANSTGPIHIAAALGKHIIGFYPKITACSPKRWGPYTEKKFVYQPSIDCSNCTPKQCKKLNCMNTINIDEVCASVKDILKGTLEKK